MIDMIHFDTLQYVEILTSAGVSDTQAKAFAKAQQKVITECLEITFPTKLATKEDVVRLKTELKGDIAELRTELKGDMAELRTDIVVLKADMVEIKSDIKLFKWMFGFLFSGVGILISGMVALLLKTFF